MAPEWDPLRARRCTRTRTLVDTHTEERERQGATDGENKHKWQVGQQGQKDHDITRMEHCIDRVGSATFVTKLNLLKGYWHFTLAPRASEISAFVNTDDFLQ